MRDRTYRVGLVGLRGITSNSAGEPPAPFRTAIGHSHAAGLSISDRFDVVAVCDLVPELLDEFERTWGKSWPDVGHYTDFSAMLRESNLDILGIATSDDTHADLGIEAAEAGVRGIFCEKPFATSPGGRGQAHPGVRGQRRSNHRRTHAPVHAPVDSGSRGDQARRNRKPDHHRGHTGRAEGDVVQERHSHYRRHLHVRRVRAHPGLGQARGGLRGLGQLQGRRRQAPGE